MDILDESTKQLYSPNNAAKRLDLSRTTIYGMMKRGELKYVVIGKDRRIPSAEINRIVSEGAPAKEG